MKRRGSKCTNQRLTIWSACFLRGHLNLLNLRSYFVIGLLCRAKWMSQLGTSLTWDQAQFSFRFVKSIPAGKAKRNESLIKSFYEMSTAHFFDWLTFVESANQNYFRCLFFLVSKFSRWLKKSLLTFYFLKLKIKQSSAQSHLTSCKIKEDLEGYFCWRIG